MASKSGKESDNKENQGISLKISGKKRKTTDRNHRFTEFGSFEGTGMTRCDFSVLRRRVRSAENRVTVRVKGAVLPVLPDSQESIPSLLVETDIPESELAVAKREASALKRQVEDLSKKFDDLKSEFDKAEKKNSLFQDDGYQLAIRSFVECALEGFYEVGGVSKLSPEKKSDWLFSRDAERFVSSCAGEELKFLFGKFDVDVASLRYLRELRTVHTDVSRLYAHRTKHIKVAYALIGGWLFGKDDAASWLFKCAYEKTPREVISAWLAGATEYEAKITSKEEKKPGDSEPGGQQLALRSRGTNK